MTREATRQAAEAMLNDDTVRQQVASGDTSAFEEMDLNEEELAMLSAAADDFPEVAGFSGFLKLGDIKGESLYPKVEISPSLTNLQTYIFKF